MIIPLGHDKGVFRFPYVTVAIALTCIGVQIYQSARGPNEAALREVRSERRAIIERAWRTHRRAWVARHAPKLRELLEASDDEHLPPQVRMILNRYKGGFIRAFDRGKVVPPSDPLMRRWRALDREATLAAGLYGHGYRPGAPLHTLVTYAFIHGGWLHLIGNLIFLWLTGANIEDRWGRVRWLLLYVGGGALAALAYGWSRGPGAPPLVGASGAVAAAMGAFLVVYHGAQIRCAYFFWWGFRPLTGTFYIRAIWALPFWFAEQVIAMLVARDVVPVAYSAHVAGFAAGVVAAVLIRVTGEDRRLQAHRDQQSTVFQQHPLYVEGVDRRAAGDVEGARRCLARLMAEDRAHVDAAVDLFRLELAHGDAPAAAFAGSEAILRLRRGRNVTAMQGVYRDLVTRHPGALLSARALFALAEVHEQSDARLAADLYQRLIDVYPDAPMAPRAMLNQAALFGERLNDAAAARTVLHGVRERYAGSPYADRASALLGVG